MNNGLSSFRRHRSPNRTNPKLFIAIRSELGGVSRTSSNAVFIYKTPLSERITMNETQSWISRRLCIGVWPTLFSINRLGQLSRVCLVLLVAMANLATAQDPSAEPGKQQSATITLKMSHTMRYLIYFPQDYSVKKPAPLLLFLHGAGERGEERGPGGEGGRPRAPTGAPGALQWS